MKRTPATSAGTPAEAVWTGVPLNIYLSVVCLIFNRLEGYAAVDS